MLTEPFKTASGFFIVDWATNYPHWRAWREWYHEVFGKKAFPQKLTVQYAWPPESAGGADTVADFLGKIRKEIEKEPRKDHGGVCKAIPDVVLPWRGWNDALRKDVSDAEIHRRKHWDSSFEHVPKYTARHRMGFRHPVPIDNAYAAKQAHRLAAE